MTKRQIHRDLQPIYSEVDEAVRDLESAVRKAKRLHLTGTESELQIALSRLRCVTGEIELCAEPEFARFAAHGEQALGKEEK